MSFGNKSAVHNHLATKHSLFPRVTALDAKDERFVEPLHDEGRLAERAPPEKAEELKMLPPHQ